MHVINLDYMHRSTEILIILIEIFHFREHVQLSS